MSSLTFQTSYPIDDLPQQLREPIREVERFVQAPLPLVAASALSTLSMVGQGILDVQLPIGTVVPTSLNFLSIAESGERKTTLDHFFADTVRKFQEQQDIIAQKRMREYKHDLDMWALRGKTLKSQYSKAVRQSQDTHNIEHCLAVHHDKKPLAPKHFRQLYVDTTIQALLRGLYHDWPCATLLSSEGALVLKKLGSNEQSQLNALWDGQAIDYKRVSTDSFTLRNARVNLSLMVQPAPFWHFIKRNQQAARDSGFLARMLLAYPESTQGSRETNVGERNMPFLDAYHQRLEEMLEQAISMEKRITMQMTAPAQQEWYRYVGEMERYIGPGFTYSDIKDFVSKLSNHAARLAALIHYFVEKNDQISLQSMKAAIGVCNWHATEFRRLLGEQAPLEQQKESAEKLMQWLLKLFSGSDYYASYGIDKQFIEQRGPSCVRRAKFLNPVLEQLCDEQKIRYEVHAGSKRIFLNPCGALGIASQTSGNFI